MANTPVRTAGHDPSVLVTAWFAISTAIVFWDAGFCLLRPLSFTHPLWSPYRLYQRIDLVYSPATFERFDGFTAAQALLNLVENSMNMTYLVMARQKNPTAVLVGFTAVLLTFWKTTLYWLMDYMSGPNGWGQTGHNTPFEWWTLFAIPNGFWIAVPLVISLVFGSEIARSLHGGGKTKVA